MILDLFSGPRGWSEGLKTLGLTDVGIEWDAAACATARAAGHATLEIEQRQAELDAMIRQREAWEKLLGDLDGQLGKLVQYGELDEADWLMDINEWNESMTRPYLVQLTKIIGKWRKEVAGARREVKRKK